MAKVRFVVTNIKEGIGRLQVRVVASGERVACNMGYLVYADKWDGEAQKCLPNTFHGTKVKIPALTINNAIKDVRERIEPLCSVTQAQLRSAIKGEESRYDYVSMAFADFISKRSVMMCWSKTTLTRWESIRRTMVEWQPKLRLSDFNERGLMEYHQELLRRGYKNTSVSKTIESVRTFLKWCDENGYQVPQDYKTFRPRIKKLPKTVVWLSMDEVKTLFNAELSAPLANIRDRFCFSCFTGMRFSDISSLRHSDIQGDRIHLSILKTTEDVTIELNKYSRAILERNKDKHPLLFFAPQSSVNCNIGIKKICKECGLCSPTTITYYQGNERIQETKPKYELVSMHTGRRTFICNALEKGISPLVVMKWTGHKDYEEMKPYIDIADKAKEKAMTLFDED